MKEAEVLSPIGQKQERLEERIETLKVFVEARFKDYEAAMII